MRQSILVFVVFTFAAGACLAEGPPCASAPAHPDYLPIFDGESLDGWHVSSKTGHGTGGRWMVQDGAIVGSQDRPGNGGIVITDQQYGDFEVSLEMNNDYGPDSGLFLRSTEDGRCYQAMIDYHDKGNLMGVYGEGIGAFSARNFRMQARPDQIVPVEYPAFPCPFTPEQWKKVWKSGWNQLQARIVGNPPQIETWINGVKVMDWTDSEKRLPDRGGIALQVHGGGDFTRKFVRYRNIKVRSLDTPENTLSPEEKAAGWLLLFDGKTLDGWMTNQHKPSNTPIEDGAINPHKCGGYMVVHEKEWSDFVLALDFKISKGCNSGVFFRTNPLLAKGWVGYQGLEMAVDDTTTAGMHDTGAIYDLVAPCRNAMRPAGQWNHAVIICNGPQVSIELNGERVAEMNLDEWSEVAKRPDGSTHKFSEKAWKDHPRVGYIGLQDHGSPCWCKNIKLLPLNTAADRDQANPLQTLEQIKSRIQDAQDDPMLYYRLSQTLMKLGKHDEGFEAARQAMQRFIKADDNLTWMLIDHIKLEKHRVDVHFNMGPSERKPPETGISRPISFRVWTKGQDSELLDVVDYEVGYFEGKPLTAAFGRTTPEMHQNLGMLEPATDYPTIRREATKLIAQLLKDRVE